jgi:hypothetical protein
MCLLIGMHKHLQGQIILLPPRHHHLTTKFRNMHCRGKTFIVDKYTFFSLILYFLLVSCCFHCHSIVLSLRGCLPYPLGLFPILTFLPHPKLLDLVARKMVPIITKHYTLTKICLEHNCHLSWPLLCS